MSSVILPGAHSFISGDGEGELRQWPLETWHYPLTRPIPDMDPTIDNDVQLAFAEGSTLLAAGCPDACWLVRLSLPELTVLERNEFIRRGTRARISTPPSETKEHIELTVRTDDEAFDVVISKHLEVLSKTPTAAATVARSPNGKYRLVASGEALSLQDTQNQRSVSLAFEREGLSTAWSADGRWLALASRSGKSLLLDVTTQQTRPVRTVEQTNSIAWSPSADWFVTAGDDGFLSYWREESGQFAPKRAASRHGGTFPSIVLMDLFGGVIGPGRNVADLAAFDDRVARKPSEPSRTYAVSAGYDFALRFWSDQGGPIGTPVTPTRHWQKHVLAAPEQRWLAFSDAAGHVGVVDLQNLDVQ
jgi:WD40 repeat protein